MVCMSCHLLLLFSGFGLFSGHKTDARIRSCSSETNKGKKKNLGKENVTSTNGGACDALPGPREEAQLVILRQDERSRAQINGAGSNLGGHTWIIEYCPTF